MALQEDKENFSNSVRSEVKATGLLDTPDNCWEFFIEKVGFSGLEDSLCTVKYALPWTPPTVLYKLSYSHGVSVCHAGVSRMRDAHR